MWQKRINLAVIVLTCLLIAVVVFPLIQSSRESARRTHSKNNLKQIGLALHNYASSYNGFPPGGIFDLEGRGYHGWMTSILPFMDASPLYSFINFNEPWDSKQNAGLFLNANPYYENPGEPTAHHHWEFPVAHYSANPNLMAVNSFVEFESLENTEHVFLVGELDGGFLPWGSPYNWRELDRLNSKPPIYGRSTRDGCQFLFADGHVAFIANDVSPGLLNRMKGLDVSGFKEDMRRIQTPLTFLCPIDALWFTWKGNKEELIKTGRDIHGVVKTQETIP